MRNKVDNEIGNHFNLPGHSVSNMRIVGIERVLPRGEPALRKVRESYWINEYDSVTYGLNTRD